MRNSSITKSAKLFSHLYTPLLLLILSLLSTQFLSKILLEFNIQITSSAALILHYFLVCLAWLFATWLINGLIEIIIWDRIFLRRFNTYVPKLIRDIVKIIVYFLMILGLTSNVFGTSINGFLAASGVIGLIIGFAVRNLVADLFNGLALNFDRPFSTGDIVTIESTNLTGPLKVVDTTWRTTRFETESNDLLAIPNSKLASLVITNLSKNLQGSFNLCIQVEAALSTKRALIILESAVKSAHGLMRNPEPRVLIHCLKNNAITYKILYWLEPEKTLPSEAKHSISSNILRAFRLSGFVLKRDVFKHSALMENALMGPLPPQLFLENNELFSTLSPKESAHLAENIKTHSYLKGAVVIELGEKGDSLFIVAEGLLSAYIRPVEDQEFIFTDYLGIGDYFGEMSLLAGEPRSARILAVTDTRLYEITKDSMALLFQENPGLIDIFGNRIAERQTQNLRKEMDRLHLTEAENSQRPLTEKIIKKIRLFFKK